MVSGLEKVTLVSTNSKLSTEGKIGYKWNFKNPV